MFLGCPYKGVSCLKDTILPLPPWLEVELSSINHHRNTCEVEVEGRVIKRRATDLSSYEILSYLTKDRIGALFFPFSYLQSP